MVGPVNIVMLLTDGFGGFGGISKFNRDFMQALDASSIAERVYAPLGFWKAAGEVWPTTREQRCWVHKTANVRT
jgi:hypothetical protein